MSTKYELTPDATVPYVERQKHWPKDEMKTIRCFVIAEDEARAREICVANTKDEVWQDTYLTKARMVSEKEYFIGST